MLKLVSAAIVTCALGLGAWVVLERATHLRSRASAGGLDLSIRTAEWVEDQMDHGGDGFQKPESMMVDYPERGVHRLQVSISVHNGSSRPKSFEPSELRLLSNRGEEWKPVSAEIGDLKLGPNQFAHAYVHYDVPEDVEGELRLAWVEKTQTIGLRAIEHPPEHERKSDAEPTTWPDHVVELPKGDADRGEKLYTINHACGSCHGEIKNPKSARVGPTLAGYRTQTEGLELARQHLYESILEPNAKIAPDCNGRPCPKPSTMPPYAGSLDHASMADLLAYIVDGT